MRLIDADALIDLCNMVAEKCHGLERSVIRQFVATVEWQPTADVIEVVRCKDCKWGREVCGNIECQTYINFPLEHHGYDWFCPNGERRTDE